MPKLLTRFKYKDGEQVIPPEVAAYVFFCPGCRRAHVYSVQGPVVWKFDGDMDSPTFSPSLLTNPKGEYHVKNIPTCHLHVTKGRIDFCADSEHALAGKSVPLEDFPENGFSNG